MAKRLVISRNAFKDIDRIIEFNNERNQNSAYSIKIIKKLYSRFNKILDTPNIGLKTEQTDIYILIWDNFYIYYRFINSTELISIVNIFHQKEDVSF